MKIQFVPSPSAFASFDGVKRTCVKYEKAKHGVLRCGKYKKGAGHPVCDSRLVDGGRSPGLIRGKRCAKQAHRATRKSRKHRRSRRK